MDQDTEKTILKDSLNRKKFKQVKPGYTRTAEIYRRSLVNELPAKQHGFLEIIQCGHKPRCIELDDEEVVIGRSPDCDIQLTLEHVSRKHARIFYINEEYQIEDLESTNGVYVNGVKVAKCNLRNHDQIEIGEVKVFFNEDKVRKKI